VVLFWDYDTQWGADASRSGAKAWGMAEFEHTERLLELYHERNMHACFACVGAAALEGNRPYHDPKQIRRLYDAGHEIASHSHKHEWLPGLSPADLRESLVRSKEALENCTGGAVETFVPPWNQPYDYLRVGSLSLSERRETRGRSRTDVPRLCAMLHETGYRFVRLAFRTLLRRLADAAGLPDTLTTKVSRLGDVRYVRLTTPAGFAEAARLSVSAAAADGHVAVIWGHPHSLSADNAQHERHLVPFLDWLVEMRSRRLIDVVLPRTLTVHHGVPAHDVQERRC